MQLVGCTIKYIGYRFFYIIFKQICKTKRKKLLHPSFMHDSSNQNLPCGIFLKIVYMVKKRRATVSVAMQLIIF